MVDVEIIVAWNWNARHGCQLNFDCNYSVRRNINVSITYVAFVISMLSMRIVLLSLRNKVFNAVKERQQFARREREVENSQCFLFTRNGISHLPSGHGSNRGHAP